MNSHLFISGTRKGLGKALAEFYLAQGYHVSGCSRGESSIDHPNYLHVQGDVSDERAVRQMVRTAQKEQGSITALINNAGIASMNALLLTPSPTARGILETNVMGTFHLIREVGKQMCQKRSGRIVNLSSIAVPFNLEGEAMYAASKAAIETLTRVAAREFGSYGITVNAIGPAVVDTDLTRTIPKAKRQALQDRQAIPQAVTTADVCHAVDFFLHPQSGAVSGQVLYLGGVF